MIEWKRVVGNNGLSCWESKVGRACGADCPPETPPLTRTEFYSLPNETPIIVLWGGGNGPSRYVLRDGRAAIPGEKDMGSDGAFRRVGDCPMEDKVWVDEAAATVPAWSWSGELTRARRSPR